MGLISYTNLEDGTPITANIFNERFGQIISVLNGGLDQNNFANGGIPASALQSSVFEKIYPVGSLYYNATDNTNPATLLGFGTWVAFGAGRVPVGYDNSDSDFDAAEKTGGSKELQKHKHGRGTLVTSSAGAHTHGYTAPPAQTVKPIHGTGDFAHGFNDGSRSGTTGSSGAHTHAISGETAEAGAGESGNLQPYITVYIWKRTA